MISSFIKFIHQNTLIQPGDKVLVAVSGGVDSVVMLDLFHHTGYKFAIAHCNFKLRGDESDADEAFVKQLAHDYDVELFGTICNASKFAKTNGLSIQVAARRLRYSWFKKVCVDNNYQLVAIGHNEDDKIETFFINLFRGAGVKGLRSIPLVRDNIIRPLMFASRKSILEYATKNKLHYREDSSNSLDYYLRNKIRHQLIPKVEEISPGFKNATIKSIDNLSDSDLLLESVVKDKKKQLFVIKSNNTIQVSIAQLQKLIPTNIWMYYLLKNFGFIRQISDAICVAINDKQNIGSKFSSSDYELLIDRSNIIIRKKTTNIIKKTNIELGQSKLDYPIKLTISNYKNSSDFAFSASTNVAYFNQDKLKFPLTIRPWQKGDRIIPFGMNGSKLVSDILINNKVNSFEKEETYVLLSGKKIIWVVGHRTSNDFRVKKSTKDIYFISLMV